MEFRRRPRFRFTQEEVAEMEEHLRGLNNATPHRNVVQYLAEKFSASNARSGKTPVDYKQVRTWFQNRKYRAQSSSSSASNSGNSTSDGGQVEFEAKSTRNGAWYDVAAFLSRRFSETGEQEVRVRFSGFGAEEDQWINVRKCVRLRSLPCEAAECADVLPGDLILCHQVTIVVAINRFKYSLYLLRLSIFLEGKEQALYFDARVLEVERRTHDISGCRCTFLVCYDHDRSKDIVPLRKVCRRPETRASASADAPLVIVIDHRTSEQKAQKPHKMMDVNAGQVTMVHGGPSDNTAAPLLAATNSTHSDSAAGVKMGNAKAALLKLQEKAPI